MTRWGKNTETIPYTKGSQEVESIIDGTRSGGLRILFKVINITKKRTKMGQLTIMKERGAGHPKSLFILRGS